MPSASLLKEVLERKSQGKQEELYEGGYYHPEIDYYFFDWWCPIDVRHIRSPFRTLKSLSFLGTAGCSEGKGVYQTAKDFRVLPEKWLSEPRLHWVEEIKSNVPDFITNRQMIFDDRYEGMAVMTTGEQSLGQLKEETPEEWFIRIRQDHRLKSDWEYSWKHLSFENGKWVRTDKKGEI